MLKAPGLPAIVVTFFVVSLLLPRDARAFDLSGAWASQADMCNLVFTKKNGKVVFTELSDLYGSGFVIDGNNIAGKAAKCAIQSKKQDGDSIEIAAACASSIMTQNVRFSLTILDDNNISRLVPEIEGMTLRYSRCKL
jgi:hypothetical protein